MKIYRVIGNVTLNRCHPTYNGATLIAIEPVDQTLYGKEPNADPDMVVAWDDRGAGLGALVAISDGGEAANPFRPEMKAVDAYCSAILDTVHIDSQAIRQLKN